MGLFFRSLLSPGAGSKERVLRGNFGTVDACRARCHMPQLSLASDRSGPISERIPRLTRWPELPAYVWQTRWPQLREYLEVCAVISAITLVGWPLPLTYHTLGLIYLLGVILLSLRIGRWPVLFAAVASAAVWDYVFIPPRLAFSVLESDDVLLLGTYFVVALVSGQLTARVRATQREEHERERRATALFHLTRAIAEAKTLSDAMNAALRQADALFGAQTAVLLVDMQGNLQPQTASSFELDFREQMVAENAWRKQNDAGRFTETNPDANGVYMPLLRAGQVLGIFAVQFPPALCELLPARRELMQGFASQIALLVEREHLRAASEREKFFAESDRLHRTLLDSVSHELKTPLAVLRSAASKLGTDDAQKRANLAIEICVATRRLDRLVGNLLNQTRLDSGGLRPQLDWCDARDLIVAAKTAWGDALAGRPLKTNVPDEMPLFRADAALMEQAIGNLLLNAALHTPVGCPVDVTAGLERREGRDWVFLRVDDHGPGIPVQLRETIFQKFRRGPGARAGGLGLGLSIVRGFMLAQSGEVTVGQSPAGGARFTLGLPYVAHEWVPTDEN